MLTSYIDEIPETAIPYLKEIRPTTLIYPKGINLAPNLMGLEFQDIIFVKNYLSHLENQSSLPLLILVDQRPQKTLMALPPKFWKG